MLDRAIDITNIVQLKGSIYQDKLANIVHCWQNSCKLVSIMCRTVQTNKQDSCPSMAST